MASAYVPMRLKRKDLEEVNDDFSDFSLSSPARKIRRLDAGLPPIMEEEEAAPPQLPQGPIVEPLLEDESPYANQNPERALVLFKPVNTPLLIHSSSSSSLVPDFSVDSDIISGLKNQFPWSNNHESSVKITEIEEHNKNDVTANECMAVVPWIRSHWQPTNDFNIPQAQPSLELMEDEEMAEATMDIGDGNASAEIGSMDDSLDGIPGRDGLPHWWQQHCVTPQLPQHTSTPVPWFQ